MKKVLMFLVICGFVMTMSASAFAMVLPVGAPFSIGSWSQQFNESGVGSFNQIAVWSLSGDIFEAPAFTAFSASGWTSYDPSASNAFAFGPDNSNLNFNINFVGTSATPLSFLFMASQDLTAKEWAFASWNNGWTIRAATGEEIGNKGPTTPVPEPTTILLLGMGALGLFGLKKRKVA